MANDLISRQAAIDRILATGYADQIKDNLLLILRLLPSAQPEKCSDILDELKYDDYYNYIHTGHSRFSEDDWDYLIYNAKEKEKLHERLDNQTDVDGQD